jgi:maltose operon substrate-binding protein precursor MalM
VRRHAFLVLVIAALVGCAAMDAERRKEGLASSRAAIEAAVPCCKTFDELPLIRMSIPFESEVAIDRTGPAFVFAKGKSFFRAFELPTYDSPYELEIVSRTAASGSFALTVNESWFFHPVLLFLDEMRKPIATVRDFRFFRETWGEGPRMIIRLNMDATSKNARYLVAYTEPEYIGRAIEYQFPGGVTPITTASGTIIAPSRPYTLDIPFNYEGRIGIRARPRKATP